MSLKKRMIKRFPKLSMPISYKLLDKDKLLDARNIFDNKGVTETRHGIARYNSTSLGGEVLSVSFYKKESGSTYRIVKVGSTLISVAASGAHTTIKTGLSSTTKHRGVTMGDRHYIFVGLDGLYQFDGTTVTQLGQSPPGTGSVAVSNGGSLANSTTYKVGLTFYSSSTGFESNVYESAQVSTSSPNLQIDVTNIPGTAANATIDKVLVYLKNVTTNTSYLYVTELDLGDTSHTIDSVPTSTSTPPTTHAAPLAGGGKYPVVFGKRLAYTGNNTYKSDVFISEEYLPDAWDDTTTAKTLEIPGQGDVTGIAVGLYDNNYLSPYLVIFKKTTTVLYSELGEMPSQVTIDEHVGCVSHDTIKVRNGVITFMSENGFYSIYNGSIFKQDGKPVSLGGGDIDDIFSRDGWVYQLNSSQFSNFFSVYYPTLGHYMTFVSEAGNNAFFKAYNYEEKVGGFRAYEFKMPFRCACEGEDDEGDQCVYMGDTSGYLFTHSVKNSRHDEDTAAAQTTIPVFFYIPFVDGGEDAVTYNFRTLTVKAISSTNAITVKAFPAYNLANGQTTSFDFSNSGSGFILDVSRLDEGVLADDRLPKKYIADVNSTGETMTIGFFQDILDANIGIISTELQFNRNGNGNT